MAKGYSFYIDYRDSRNFKNKKLSNIITLYKTFRKYKTKESGHSVNYKSYVGDAVLIIIKSGNIQGNFIYVIDEIDNIARNVEGKTKEKLGIGLSYGEIEKITDNKGPYIVSEATDWAATASTFGKKNNEFRFVLPLKAKNIPSICSNGDLKNYLNRYNDNINSHESASGKYYYFNCK